MVYYTRNTVINVHEKLYHYKYAQNKTANYLSTILNKVENMKVDSAKFGKSNTSNIKSFFLKKKIAFNTKATELRFNILFITIKIGASAYTSGKVYQPIRNIPKYRL